MRSSITGAAPSPLMGCSWKGLNQAQPSPARSGSQVAITISTKRWEEAHGKAPRGRHFWEFSVSHPTKGVVLYSTDGEFASARDRALVAFRRTLGARAKLEGELRL